jgi:hypothetical protein
MRIWQWVSLALVQKAVIPNPTLSPTGRGIWREVFQNPLPQAGVGEGGKMEDGTSDAVLPLSS